MQEEKENRHEDQGGLEKKTTPETRSQLKTLTTPVLDKLPVNQDRKERMTSRAALSKLVDISFKHTKKPKAETSPRKHARP